MLNYTTLFMKAAAAAAATVKADEYTIMQHVYENYQL